MSCCCSLLKVASFFKRSENARASTAGVGAKHKQRKARVGFDDDKPANTMASTRSTGSVCRMRSMKGS